MINIRRLCIIPFLLLAFLLAGCQQGATTSAPATSKSYVGSVSSDKYHRPGCRWAENIKPDNAVWFSTKEEAAAAGYVACKTCKP